MEKRKVSRRNQRWQHSPVTYILLILALATFAQIMQPAPVTGQQVYRRINDTMKCSDSDGYNILLQGQCTDGRKNFKDYCLSNSTLIEFTCSNKTRGGCMQNTVNCAAYGMACQNGACTQVTPPPTISNVQDYPDPINATSKITFSANWQSKNPPVQLQICKQQLCSNFWCLTVPLTQNNPATCQYQTQTGDMGTNPYFARVCDTNKKCSNIVQGTFTVISSNGTSGTCGNSICEVFSGETCYNCASDCGICTAPDYVIGQFQSGTNGTNQTNQSSTIMTLVAQVANEGASSTQNSITAFSIPGVGLQTISIPPVQSGSSKQAATGWSLTSGKQYLVTITADYTNVIKETNETNNIAKFDFYVP